MLCSDAEQKGIEDTGRTQGHTTNAKNAPGTLRAPFGGMRSRLGGETRAPLDVVVRRHLKLVDRCELPATTRVAHWTPLSQLFLPNGHPKEGPA